MFYYHFYGLYLSFSSQTTVLEWLNYFCLSIYGSKNEMDNFFCKSFVFYDKEFSRGENGFYSIDRASEMTCVILDLLVSPK